jgi:hypothetical protein
LSRNKWSYPKLHNRRNIIQVILVTDYLSLQYVTITRPDIIFAVKKSYQFMHSSTITHWTAVKRILRYLNGSLFHGLTIRPAQSITLYAYCDADWTDCPDDRRSTYQVIVSFWVHLSSLGAQKNSKQCLDQVQRSSTCKCGTDLGAISFTGTSGNSSVTFNPLV